MRLVVLTPNDPESPGGIERFTQTLIPLLRDRGWDVETYWCENGDRSVSSRVDKLGVAGAAGALRVARRHRDAIARADAVLANGVMGWPVRHPRMAVVFHGNYAGYAKAIRSTVSSAEYVRTRYVHGGLMAVGGARGIPVEVSRTAAGEIRRFYGFRRVVVIENGIAPGSFAGGDGEAARRRHGLPPGPLVLFAGRLEYRKGVDVLRELPARLPEGATLVVCGPRRLELPGVVNLGHQGPDEIRDLYAAASVSAQPTRHEGSSFALIEAQDAGLPLVTCRQGHVAEMLVREPALRPTVVPSLEAGAFADRVRLLLEDRDLARQVAEAGRRYVRRYHDAQTMADRYDELLRGGGRWQPAAEGGVA
jgi:glycosyltransferase involved in cell wall biosynthesis